jgi:hypothetical protein
MTEEINGFAKCSMCRKVIAFGAKYLKCTVSTCNSKRMPLFFCTSPCWDAHLGSARHRDPGYTEEQAPKKK